MESEGVGKQKRLRVPRVGRSRARTIVRQLFAKTAPRNPYPLACVTTRGASRFIPYRRRRYQVLTYTAVLGDSSPLTKRTTNLPAFLRGDSSSLKRPYSFDEKFSWRHDLMVFFCG